MPLAVDVVKQQGRRPTEPFARHKLHYSIKAACLSVRSPDGVAEETARHVCDAVIVWLEPRPEVTSDDIRRRAAKHLRSYHPEAAYLYEQHKNII